MFLQPNFKLKPKEGSHAYIVHDGNDVGKEQDVFNAAWETTTTTSSSCTTTSSDSVVAVVTTFGM